MKRLMSRLISVVAAAVLALQVAETAQARQSVGLVLSGGGAKGIAHIGVIKALEENDIPIDFVAGTSMGAIVGSLYAMGYTTDEMMELITSRAFGYWSTGTIDPKLSYYFSSSEPTPAMFNFSIGSNDSTSAVPASLISPLPMNFEFMSLFAPYTAACDGNFDRLMVPFRCVASYPAEKRKVVLRRGELGSAVRASMSFPGVFQPTEIDGKLLYDGGLYDNFPLDVMRDDFAPDIMIGVDVSSSDNGPATSIIAQLENLICTSDPADTPDNEIVRLRLHLDRFGLLDFPKAREIYDIGYDFAIQRMDSIRTHITARTTRSARDMRREQFRARVPYLRFDSVSVIGGTPHQNHYMAHLFGQDASTHSVDTFGVDKARQAYYRALSTGRIRDMQLSAVRSDTARYFRLNARAWLRNDLQAGVGGYLTSSTNSFLFLSARLRSLSFHSIDAGLRAWVGQSYMAAALDGRIYTPTHLPMAVRAEAVASRRKYYESDAAFFDNSQPVHVIGKEYFGRIILSMAAGRSGAIDAFGGIGNLLDYFYRDSTIGDYTFGRDRASYVLWQAGAGYSRSTIDSENYPTEGSDVRVRALATGGTYNLSAETTKLGADHSSPFWIQAEARTRHYFSPSRHFSFGLESHVMLSSRGLSDSYNASVTAAPSFEPTPSAANAFRVSFRANSFVAAGIVPVYRYNDALSARVGIYGFLPLRKICKSNDNAGAYYGRWLRDPEMFGEAAIAYKLPFASITGWCNYATGHPSGWSAGLSFGIYITAPRFLQL